MWWLAIPLHMSSVTRFSIVADVPFLAKACACGPLPLCHDGEEY
jgi:hypothetical protein